MAATNRRLLKSESHGDSNRCTHLAGQNPINTTRTLPTPVHVCPAYASCGRSSYVATFHKPPIALDEPYCSREKGLPTQPQPGWVIRRSATQFLFQHSHWSSNKSQAYDDNRLLGLPGPYHRYAIDMLNTCSRVSTPRFLTDTARGYHIENLRIATTLSPPFPFKGSNDPPNGPARSQIIQTTTTNWTGEGNKP
jgi:hypothetical protein